MTAKQGLTIVPVRYSIKMHVSCIKGHKGPKNPKTYNTFRGALKIHLDDSRESSLYKFY